MAGKIKFVKRGQSLAATVPEDDLAAHEWGSEPPNPIDKARAQDLELPHEINVLYFNSGADYQQGTQKSERQTGAGVNAMTISLPVVLNDTKAKQVADVNLYNAWVQRTTYTLQLSRKWSKIEPTDVIDVVYNNVSMRMRVIKKEDAKGIIKLECVAEDSAIYTQSGTGAGTSNIPAQVVTVPVQTLAMFLDIPLLRDEDNDAGMYFAACGYRTGWTGCALFKSIDNGSTYNQVFAVSDEASIGNATTVLGTFAGGNIFDELNSVTVKMFTGTLSSTTELAVLNGANYALLGDELIQYKTAELISANTYKLSGLLRGRRGTEWAMSAHSIGDRFVFVSQTSWRRMPLQSSDIGLARLFKPVSYGMTLQQTAATPIIPEAIGLECYSPVLAGAGRNTSNDITVSWTRRGRLNAEWRDYTDIPLGEATESYEVDIMDSTTVKRTITSTTNSATYTSSQQITDFGYELNRVSVNIYQVSAITGRGYPLSATLEMGAISRLSTRWRINILELVDPFAFYYPQIVEIEMATSVGGSDACVGGAASAQFNSVDAINAFDDNPATSWSGGTTKPQWIEYTFASPVNILQLKIQDSNFYEFAPKSFDFQYYDGANWQTVMSQRNLSWGFSETKTFIV